MFLALQPWCLDQSRLTKGIEFPWAYAECLTKPSRDWYGANRKSSITLKMAQEDNASLNQFIVMAVAEKVSALNTENFFKERAARGSRERFLEIMDKVPDLPVREGDEAV